MLKNDFYTIISREFSEHNIVASIRFNAGHSIFDGHFPGQPVVPGVCMMQIIKEFLSETLGIGIIIRKAAQMKFLSMIVPDQSPEVDLLIQINMLNENMWNVDATIKKEPTVFFKMKAQVEIVSSAMDQQES